MEVNLYKTAVAIVGLICLTIGMMTKAMSTDFAGPMFTLILGYILGNGVQARKGSDVPGIIRPKPEGRRAEDQEREDMVNG